MPEGALQEAVSADQSGALDLYARILREGAAVALAAEFKRCSPSKGDIAVGVDAGSQARAYVRAGASVVSVLTEPKWFKGSLEDLRCVRDAVGAQAESERRPRAAVLRKDFIIDAYQLLEARAHGADTALLIVAILEDDLLASLIARARALGMEPLVEVNSVEELSRALVAGAEVIGVNNRNLHTFRVDLGTTERVARALAEHNAKLAAETANAKSERGGAGARQESDSGAHCGRVARPPIVMALSGITSRADVERYERCGVRGVLVGEALMRAPDPGQMVRELLGLNGPRDISLPSSASFSSKTTSTATTPVRVKICGIRDAPSALVAARAGADFIGLIFAPKSKRCVTTSQARKIVSALRAFREQEDDMGPSPVQWHGPSYDKSKVSENGAGQWFRSWADELGAKCTSNVTRPLVVGVFQNQTEQEVCQIVKESGVDLVQLHGDEDWKQTGGRSACGGVPSIKVVHIEVAGDAARPAGAVEEADSSRSSKRQKTSTGIVAEEAPAAARRRLLGLPADQGIPSGPSIAVLLDTKVPGNAHAGGTGVSFDWDLARAVAETETGSALFPLIVAGGLTPENVADAVQACRPWGVDVASGVERDDGSRDKDHEKIRAFIRNAKGASR